MSQADASSVAAKAGVVPLDDYRWMIPRSGDMRVPGVIFANRALLERMLSDRTFEQVKNAAHLPGILEASLAMPDAHWGYGLPVGGVVATHEHDGVISPGAVGYDIGCGVRLLRSRLTRAELTPHLDAPCTPHCLSLFDEQVSHFQVIDLMTPRLTL